LASKGIPILVHYNKSEAEAMDVAAKCRTKGGQADIVHGDFSSNATLQQFIMSCRNRFPSIKNLINNVGNYLIKSALETSSDEWTNLFQINTYAPLALSQAFLSSIAQAQGNIINIGVVGLNAVRADVHRSAYMASKMALFMLTKSLAKELAPFHVRVNMVSPGYLENAIDLPKDLGKMPMGRAAKLGEVARVVAFLLQEENSYITGQNVEIGGGINL
jgi:NAD(P)-dependent dehydrogenase (short-subunit alcohol dehydrogenase family)